MDLTMDSTSELEKPLSRIKSFDTIFKESTEFSNLVESHLDKPDFSPAPILLPTDLPDQNKSDVQTLTSSTEHPQFQWHRRMTKVKRLLRLLIACRCNPNKSLCRQDGSQFKYECLQW